MAKFKAGADVADPVAESQLHDEEPGDAVAHYMPTPLAKVGEVSGDVTRSDFSIPLLQVVQGTGPLSRLFATGDVVIAKEVKVASDGETWEFIALSMTKYFQERLKYDPNGPRPLQFATEKEVRGAGLTTEWVNNGPGTQDTPPTAEPVAVVAMLVKQNAGNTSPVFSIEGDGERWALCQWIVQRTAYTRVAKRLFTARATELAGTGLLSGRWQVVVRDATVGGNVIKAATLSLIGRNTDEFVAELKKRFE